MTENEFKDILAAHKDRVFSYACYLLRSHEEAEDVTQEAFVRLWRSAEAVHTPAIRSWLLRVTHNLCIDRARRHGFERRIFLSVDGQRNPAYQTTKIEDDPAAGFDQFELRQRVMSAMQGLPRNLRSAIILRELQGLSYQEIADVLDQSLSAVKVNIHRARKLLRKHLAPILGVSSGESP